MADKTAALKPTEKHLSIPLGIPEVIAAYKADFAYINDEAHDETYKWRAVQWYKEHWNINAPDFAAMLSSAFSKADNLLTAGMYYAYGVLCNFAEMQPETVREMFRELYDESQPLETRYDQFRKSCDALLIEYRNNSADHAKAHNHYQDLHAVSVYLFFAYPEKYFIYKASVEKAFRALTGLAEETHKPSGKLWKLESYSALCQSVLDVAAADADLLKRNRSRFDADCYPDPSSHLLALDIVYYGGAYLYPELTKTKPAAYWPSSTEYDPHITTEQWKTVLDDRAVTSPETLAMLRMMLELGGESTCAHLASVYGNVHNYYNMLGSTFGKRVAEALHCPVCRTDEKTRYFPIPFVGRSVTEDGTQHYAWKLRDELKEALEQMDLSQNKPATPKKTVTDVPKNTILYGPPGTGKTYQTVRYAVAILENKPLQDVEREPYQAVLLRYNRYKAAGRIEFTTFHQSYGYEEFIEGIRPVLDHDNDDQKDLTYEIAPGLFKLLCDRASEPILTQKNQDIGLNASPTIWKVSLAGTGKNPTRDECLKSGHIRIGYDSYGESITSETNFTAGGKNVLDAFIYKMQVGDIVLSCFSASTIDAIGVVTGDYEWHDEYEQYKRLRKVNWLVKDIREDITEANGSTMTLSSVYRLRISLSDVMALVSKHSSASSKFQANDQNYVFIMDEINRGNISKIFGELITLIEPTKRLGQPEGISVKLPYSKTPFGVPDNVYLIGTMNTADRSIATLDTALRRRFSFREMQPDPAVLEGIFVEGLSIQDLFVRMNRKISVLYDNDHTIGHAYFTKLKESPTLETLASIFENNILPLLQEYFYEDYEKIRLVLGDNNKPNEAEQFITAKAVDYAALFGNTDFEMDDAFQYKINPAAFHKIEAYRSI